MKLQKERTGCGLSMRITYAAALLKEKMNYAAEQIPGIFVPSDVTWEGEWYTFYISHRQSLKEYIYENGLRPADFFLLLRKLEEIFSKAKEHGISPYEFVFNYECIFVGNSFSDLEFIYAPDCDTYKDGMVVYNKCSDLAAIVSLHIEYDTSERTVPAEPAVTEALRILSDWEADLSAQHCLFPAAELAPILEAYSADKSRFRLPTSWYPFLAAEAAIFLFMMIWMFRRSEAPTNPFVTVTWLILLACTGYLLLPHRKQPEHKQKSKTYKWNIGNLYNIAGAFRRFLRRAKQNKGVCRMELNGDMLLKGVKYTIDEEDCKEVHIGRDDNWADVPVGLTFVSRKHATLYKQNDKWYIKDLKSTNGTFVNGAKIIPEQPLFLRNGSEISLGIPETKFIFRLP